MDTKREAYTARFEALALPAAKEFADFARGKPGEPLPCWAEIARRFEQVFDTDEARVASLEPLIAEKEPRPLELFLRAYRERPAVLSAMVAQAQQLPEAVQCALAAFDEARPELLPVAGELMAPARQILGASPEARKREREIFEARTARLLVMPASAKPAEQGAP
jgi:hypothetical protein